VQVSQPLDLERKWPSSYADGGYVSWSKTLLAANGEIKVSFPDIRCVAGALRSSPLTNHFVELGEPSLYGRLGCFATPRRPPWYCHYLSPKLRISLCFICSTKTSRGSRSRIVLHHFTYFGSEAWIWVYPKMVLRKYICNRGRATSNRSITHSTCYQLSYAVLHLC
jgi:hypothetical protein